MTHSITQDQFKRLQQIMLEAKDAWDELRKLETEAYEITLEEDRKGFTSDLVLHSEAKLEHILKELDIEVVS